MTTSREEKKIRNKYAGLIKRAVFRIEKKYDQKMKEELSKIGQPKKPKKNALESKYVTLLQKYARLRDVGDDGTGPCISCGQKVHWKDGNGGHYISRKKKSVKYNLDNIHLQCVGCNKYKYGNPEGYRLGLIKKIGLEKVEFLENFSKISGSTPSKEGMERNMDQIQKKIDEILERLGE